MLHPKDYKMNMVCCEDLMSHISVLSSWSTYVHQMEKSSYSIITPKESDCESKNFAKLIWNGKG